MVLIYSRPPLESTNPQHSNLAVRNDCCWMVLSLAAMWPGLFVVSEFHSIERSAIVHHSALTLHTVVGRNKQMASRCARNTCARTHENESRSITANSGCWQQYILSRRFEVQWFIAESQRLTRWIQNAFERNFICTYSCCIQIVSGKACLYNLTIGNLTMQLSSSVNIWQALSLLLLLQVHSKLTQGHEWWHATKPWRQISSNPSATECQCNNASCS